MRIGIYGRLGVGLIVAGLVIDAILRLESKSDYRQVSLWQLSDPFLPIILFPGFLCLLGEMILFANYRGQRANSGKFTLTSVGPQRPEADHVEPPASPASPSRVYAAEISAPKPTPPVPSAGRRPLKWYGYALILLGVILYAGLTWWMDPRALVPLDLRVSLRPGHNRSQDFTISLQGDYFLELESTNLNCYWGVGQRSPIHWQAFRSGRLVAEGYSHGWYSLGAFLGERASIPWIWTFLLTPLALRVAILP